MIHETAPLRRCFMKISAELLEAWLALTSVKYHDNPLILMLFNQWLTLTSIKYHDNLLILMPFNQWLALTMLRTTGPWLHHMSKHRQRFWERRRRSANINSTMRSRWVIITRNEIWSWHFDRIPSNEGLTQETSAFESIYVAYFY